MCFQLKNSLPTLNKFYLLKPTIFPSQIGNLLITKNLGAKMLSRCRASITYSRGDQILRKKFRTMEPLVKRSRRNYRKM